VRSFVGAHGDPRLKETTNPAERHYEASMTRSTCPILVGNTVSPNAAFFVERSCPSCSSEQRHTWLRIPASAITGPDKVIDFQERFGLRPDRAFPIVQCLRCSFIYSLFAPPSEVLAALYDSTAEPPENLHHPSLNARWVGQQLSLAAALLQQIALQFGDAKPHILDFGCGFGALVQAINGPTASCVGYETSTYMLRYLRRTGLPVISSLDAAPPMLHGIILSDVLEHLADPRATLRLLRDLLVPNGLLCVSVPAFGSRRMKAVLKAARLQQPLPREVAPWEHLNYFSPLSLRRMLRHEGFTTVEHSVDIGLRPNLRGLRRLGNAMKSCARLIRHAIDETNGSMLVLGKKGEERPDR
jgi:2-polyprenyl-3-methyl-5-hydroxy-6-metoxy-1,4-benzoquinol methylase